MTDRVHKQQSNENWRKVDQYLTDPQNYPAILEAVNICDGHSIFDHETFSMLPEFVRDHVAKVNPSDTTGNNRKNSIYLPDNSIAEELFGIYGLDLLKTVGRAHHISSPKTGRGAEANDIREQLNKVLNSDTR